MRETCLPLERKHYDPAELEEKIYRLWEERQIFSPDPNKKPYSIVIPPPNVTGRLHMGHALNNSVQDALIRYKRMDGYGALWIPGTDHAGISTQSVVKKHLDAQGINYLELGREKMIERIWEWKKKYGDQILEQLRRMGCSCDWSRTRFTMDEGLSRAVLFAFKKLYDAGLIYRGKYIVNWCPVDRTALSDDEVSTVEGGEPGHLWHFRYPLADGSGHLTIATTRPETMLGDSAVAVNPTDERYAALVGRTVKLPLIGREIPIIADDYVDKAFGSGCLKVTPAHDANDFQIGLRHNLPQINVMNEDATMGDQAPESYHGLDRFSCRARVVEELKALGLLAQVEDRMTPVGRAQRSGAIIEYRLSDQWFVKMRPLAQAALERSDRGEIKLYPERWDKVYRDWLENTRDWCISRQIWWGHRIPAWYNLETNECIVDADTPAEVKTFPEKWRQETDVLDTWFSSALWPYSTMGWPEASPDLERYYPTSLLSTAKDIIYFWVARMVMTGVQFMGEVPFREVYFHPVICDARGETMSKSKGNGIDPLHVIDGASVTELEGPIREARPENMEKLLEELHTAFPQGFTGVGADALRLTLLSLNSQSQQVQISLQRFDEVGRRFVDKLWNASRFVISSLGGADDNEQVCELGAEHLEDEWLLGRLDRCTADVRIKLDSYLFHEAIAALHQFFWDDFCDWYLELVKSRLKGSDDSDKRRVRLTLTEALSGVLRLLHPIAPYITEELWGHLHKRILRLDPKLKEFDICASAPFPTDLGRSKTELNQVFGFAQEVVRNIRNIRATANIAANVLLKAEIRLKQPETGRALEKSKSVILRAAGLKELSNCDSKPERTAAAVLEFCDIFVHLAEHLDVEAEIKRYESQISKTEKLMEQFVRKLNNPEFLARAPEEVREKEQKSLAEAEEKRSQLLKAIDELRLLRS